MNNYKGMFYDKDEDKRLYEAGAHFKYSKLIKALNKLILSLPKERLPSSSESSSLDTTPKNIKKTINNVFLTSNKRADLGKNIMFSTIKTGKERKKKLRPIENLQVKTEDNDLKTDVGYRKEQEYLSNKCGDNNNNKAYRRSVEPVKIFSVEDKEEKEYRQCLTIKVNSSRQKVSVRDKITLLKEHETVNDLIKSIGKLTAKKEENKEPQCKMVKKSKRKKQTKKGKRINFSVECKNNLCSENEQNKILNDEFNDLSPSLFNLRTIKNSTNDLIAYSSTKYTSTDTNTRSSDNNLSKFYPKIHSYCNNYLPEIKEKEENKRKKRNENDFNNKEHNNRYNPDLNFNIFHYKSTTDILPAINENKIFNLKTHRESQDELYNSLNDVKIDSMKPNRFKRNTDIFDYLKSNLFKDENNITLNKDPIPKLKKKRKIRLKSITKGKDNVEKDN